MYVRTWYFNLNIALKKYTSIDLKDEIRVTMKYISYLTGVRRCSVAYLAISVFLWVECERNTIYQ